MDRSEVIIKSGKKSRMFTIKLTGQISQDDIKVLKHFREKLKKRKKLQSPRCRTICVDFLPREGETVKKVLKVWYAKDRQYFASMIKIAHKNDIIREYSAGQRASNYILDAGIDEEPYFFNCDGALLYKHRGDKALATKILETLDPRLTPQQYEHKSGEICNYVDIMYKDLHNSAYIKAPNDIPIPLRKTYEQYIIRKKNLAEPWIKSILGSKVEFIHPTFLDVRIFNPIVALRKLFRRTIRGRFGYVHGDLHPNNIIIDKTDKPRLIDFDWSGKKRHILVDFVLMENSLRFFLCPRAINIHEQKMVDEWLLKEEGYRDILHHTFRSTAANRYYHLIASVIEKIRQHAKSSIGAGYKFNEYLLSQFLILFGLLEIEKYRIHFALRALGLIAKKLSENNWEIT